MLSFVWVRVGEYDEEREELIYPRSGQSVHDPLHQERTASFDPNAVAPRRLKRGTLTVFNRILFNLLQVLVVIAFAPLVSGVLTRLKEMVQSKRGPNIFQPYRDLWKLFHKDEVVSEHSSWIFRFTPYLAFVVPIFVTLLIPVLRATLYSLRLWGTC